MPYMCGRYTLTSPREVAQGFDLKVVPEIGPRFNIAPSQESLIVVAAGEGAEARSAIWGFTLPPRDSGAAGRRVINARSEDVEKRPLFRESFTERRCLVPANGFYEWTRIGLSRQPYYFSLPDSSVFGFAGLWSPGPDDRPGYVIMTTEANEVVAPIHGRMPVILRSQDYSSWLASGGLPDDSARRILRPWPAEKLIATPVGMRVNDPSTDDETCVLPLQGPVDLFTY